MVYLKVLWNLQGWTHLYRTGVVLVVMHTTGILNEKRSSQMWPKYKQKPKAFDWSQTAGLFHSTTSSSHKQLSGSASASNWLMFAQSGGYLHNIHHHLYALSQVCELCDGVMVKLFYSRALVYLKYWRNVNWQNYLLLCSHQAYH